MNRRDFLRYVGTGLVVGPAVVKAILATPAVAQAGANPLITGELGTWQGVRWWVKEFDGGTSIGVALGITNPMTGKVVRNAVRLHSMPDQQAFINRVWEMRDPHGEGLRELPDPPDNILAGQELLRMWAEEEAWRQGWAVPPKGWKARMAAGVRGDGVLEGREMRLPGRAKT